ncbi:MAG: hypothetical protein ACO4BU_06960 [Phycisphaerales bacterium]
MRPSRWFALVSLAIVASWAIHGEVTAGESSDPPSATELVPKLLEQGYGGGWAMFPEGEGLLVAASASYGAEGVAMPVIERRVAMHRASLEARRAVAGFLEGASVAATSQFVSRLDAGSKEAGYEAILVDRAEEEIASAIAATLRFVEVEAARDDGAGRCSVVVSLVPGRQDVSMLGTDVVESSDSEALMESMRRAVAGGWSPAEGVRAMRDRRSGEVAWIVFASETVLPGLPAATRAAAIESAESSARQRTDAAIAAAVRGEEIATNDRIDGRFEASVREFNDAVAGLSETETTVWSTRRSEFATSLARRGATPPRRSEEVIRSGDLDSEGMLITVLRVYEPRGDSDRAVANASRGPRRSDCGDLPPEPGTERVIARGTGETREKALKAALSDAVRQVNGALIVSNESLSRRYQQFVESLGGGEEISVSARDLSEAQIASFSNGMVRRYDVLEESPVGSSPYAIALCASVAVIEPGMPRGDGPATLAVLDLSIAEACKDEPRPCESFAAAFESSMVGAMIGLDRFAVVDRQNLAATDAERRFIVDRVRRGEASVEEILRVSRLVSADYLLAGSLTGFEHRRWMEPQPLRGTEEARERLRVGVTLRLIETGSGRVIWQGEFRRSWSGRDLPRDEDRSREAWAAAEAAESLARQLGESAALKIE